MLIIWSKFIVFSEPEYDIINLPGAHFDQSVTPNKKNIHAFWIFAVKNETFNFLTNSVGSVRQRVF